MKPIKSFALLAAFAAVGQSFAVEATTTPVGYVSQTLPASQFSFIGLTLHSPTVLAGVITAESSSSVTVGTTDLITLLGAPGSSTYVLELQDGTIQEVTTWNSSGVITTPDDISSLVTPNTTTFKLRKVKTVSDVFGATNSVGLKPDVDGDYQANADLVTVIGAGGVPTTFYYYNDGENQGWFTTGGDDASQLPIVYADGFYIKRQPGSSVTFVNSGELKNKPTSGLLSPGYNFLSGVAPAGLTLGNSGLQNYLAPDTTGDYQASNVDNVLLPQANGSFVTVYYYNDGENQGWFNANGDDASGFSLDGAFIVLNRGVSKPYSISVPSGYSSL